ncbi:MAG: quinone-dependent dihydroorotate dehydrogenase [Elusimicrobiota bacterium]
MLYDVLKPFLFALDAERAHEEVSGLMALAAPIPGAGALLSALTGPSRPGLEKTVFGLRFKNPVGLAAGFDKDAKLVSLLPAFGFGFLEIGSVTLNPQPGNPRPRLFRLPEQQALINRMGFNSEGARAVARRLACSPRPAIPLGINLGLNKDTPDEDAARAYADTFRILSEWGDYFVVNVSSPNTPGLRDLQRASRLADILSAVQDANDKGKPVLVKLSPDLDDQDLAACVESTQARAQGLVICNTTLSREGVPESWSSQPGGLSGAPLKRRALELVKKVRSLSRLPIIGSGGIATADDARERLEAGADLVQLYTGFVFAGPGAVKRITRGLS